MTMTDEQTGIDSTWDERNQTSADIEVARRMLPVQAEALHIHDNVYEDIPALVQEVERLRAALEQVEWVETESVGGGFCPWCENVREYGHAANCQRKTALGE